MADDSLTVAQTHLVNRCFQNLSNSERKGDTG
jgi:hypothetical protein